MILQRLDDKFEKWELYHDDGKLLSSGEGYDIGDQVAYNFRKKYKPEVFKTYSSTGLYIVTESMVDYSVKEIEDLC